MSFNWDTEEQHNWEEALEGAVEERKVGRRVLWGAAMVVVVALLGLGLWSVAQKRAQEAQEQVRAGALAGHQLAQRAAADGDGELFLNLLTNEDAAWSQAQEALLEEGLLYEGAARFYELTPVATSEVSQTVTLDPELKMATVEVEQPFVTAVRAGVTQTVRLRQTHVYVQRNGGWLLARPSNEFWSRQWRLNGDMTRISYHMRDEAVALRLQKLLEETLPQMCELPGLECPADLHVQVRLEPDPDTLVEAWKPVAMTEGSREVLLPSPTLMGTPVDEEGMELVARVYAAHVVGRVMSHVAEYECCRQGLLVRAVVERQFHHLGLRPWPLGPEEYEQLLVGGVGDIDAYGLMSSSLLHILHNPLYRETWLRTLSLVEMGEATLPRGTLLEELGTMPDYWLIGENGSTAQFIRNWIEFVYERTRSGQMAAPPQPLPDADIRLVCLPGGSQVTGSSEATVWSYDLEAEEWSEELVHDAPGNWQTIAVYYLSEEYGYLIEEHSRALNQAGVDMRLVWQHGGEQRVILEERAQSGGAMLRAYYSGSDPSGRYLLLLRNYYQGEGLYTTDKYMLDLETCSRGECETFALSGYPMWSPDGSQTLLEGEPDSDQNYEFRPPVTIYRAGAQGQNATVVGRGYSAFWLDNNHYGYLQRIREGAQEEVVIVRTADNRASVVADSADFVTLLEEERPGMRGLYLERVASNLANPRQLLVQASLPSESTEFQQLNYLFMLQLAPDLQSVDEIRLLFFQASNRIGFTLAPNGRRVAIGGLEKWIVVDLESGETHPASQNVGFSRWSPDGEWLALQHEHYLLLYAPASDYRRVVVRDVPSCGRGLYW